MPKPVEPPKLLAEVKPVPLPEVKPQRVIAPPKVEVGKFEVAPNHPAPVNNPEKPVEVGSFSGSSAVATVKAPANKVQTGGFGDPNGVHASPNAREGPLVAAKLGSFDLPQGDGQGNGTGGTKGIKGTIASTGFDNGIAGPGNGDHNAGRHSIVQTTSFGDMQAGPAETHVRRVAAAVSPTTPVEILAKPTPVYTDEAKKLHIEGEVLVEVMFTAKGTVRVLRVIRGLGHGLDEAAISAAERIRYKPAQRDGQAVDSNATLHIVFQLA
jgi:TonB family protein